MLPLLALMPATFAATFDLVADDAVYRALSGACPEVEHRLQSRIDRDPADLAARLALDGCRVGGTEEATAAADLRSLYEVGAPFDPAALLKRKDVTADDLAKVRREAQAAAAWMVRQLASKGYYQDAQLAASHLEDRVGRSGSMTAARVGLERMQNGAAGTWRFAAAALQAWPEDVDVLEELGMMVYDDGAGAPAALVDAVLVRGRATAKLNALVGLARGGRGADCLSRAGSIFVPEDFEEKLRQTTYRCAIAAKDLTSADRIARSGLRQLDARQRGEHGGLLVDAGRPADAIGIVRDVATADPKCTETAFRALAALGDTAGMAELAAQLPPDNIGRLTAAVALYNARNFETALSLMQGGCERFVGQNAVLCTRVVDGSRRALNR
jgi:hypothetical protein